jgi:S1-C subfamily serine protease
MVVMGRGRGRLAAAVLGLATAGAVVVAPARATLSLALDFLPLSERARVESLTASTVRIVAFGCGATSGDGTGVVLDDGRVLTTRHVVDGAIALNVVPDIGRTSNGTALVSTTVDAGTVHTPAPLDADGLRLAAHDPVAGDELLVGGYPLGGPLRVLRADVVDVVDGTPLGQRGMVVRLDVDAERGMSGGPLLDRAGRVAGVMFAVDRGSGHTLAIPASSLRDAVTTPGALTQSSRCAAPT